MRITKYRTFTRRWWKDAETPGWPNGLEPDGGARKTYRGTFLKESDARAFCAAWNAKNEPGRYSVKCEYEIVKKRGKFNIFLGREI
jgi:hypothetical protein